MMNIITSIMIKSSDKKFNNSYRILRVLENKDLLVIDSERQYYIFAQFYSDNHHLHHNLSPPPRKNQENQKMNTSNILYYQQLILIDGLNYLVFKMPNKNIIWANNIGLQKLNQKTFTNSIIRQALMYILDKLLWLGSDFINRLVNNKNFLLVNGHLYFILMPRNNSKVLSLKRNQKHRSLSSDVSISNILKKQSNIIKDFCQIIWLIIKKTPFCLIKRTEIEDFGSVILFDLITKSINLETALEKINGLQIKTEDKNHQVLMFIKKQNVRRRSTIDTSSLRKPHKNILFNRNNQNLLSKRMRTQQVYRSQKNDERQENVTFYPKNRTIIIQRKNEEQNKKIFKRRNYSLQNDLQEVYKTPNKIKPQSTSIFSQKKSICVSQKQKNKYNNWVLQKNMKRIISETLQQKLQNQTKKALLKFQLSCFQNKNVQGLKQKEEKLKNRLLHKVMKFKIERIQRQIQTQQIQSQFVPTYKEDNYTLNKHQQNEYAQQKQDNNHQIIQITKSIFNQNKGQINIDNTKTGQKPKISKQEEWLFKKQEDKNIGFSKVDNQSNCKQQNANFVKYQKQIIPTESQLQEIILEPKQQKQKKNENAFKRNKMLQENKFQQLQDMQTLYFQQQRVKQQKTTKKTWIEQPKIKKTQQSDSEKHIKKIEVLINQYLTFINILGDITASAIKNKAKIANIPWRKTVYFLYERFYFERINFNDNLRAKNNKIIRPHQQVTKLEWSDWNKSLQRQTFLVDIEKQNAKLSETFKKFALKLLKEDNLETSFKQFLKNCQKILHSKNKKNQFIIAKYGTALIINEYDKVKQSNSYTSDILHFLQDCLYGLKIIAELEGLANKPLDLSEYKRYTKNEEQLDDEVEQIYELFYKQQEIVKQT